MLQFPDRGVWEEGIPREAYIKTQTICINTLAGSRVGVSVHTRRGFPERLPGQGINQPSRLTRPSCPSCPTHPLLLSGLFSLLSQAVSGSLIKRWGPPLSRSRLTGPLHTTHHYGGRCWERDSPGGLSRIRGPTHGPHCNQDSPGLQKSKLETIPSFLSQCSQGTPSA